jgi:GNAT superfamily N-acetyltransferase
MNIQRCSQLPEIDHLADASRKEGFRFVERLIAGFESGENQFGRPGEALFAVFDQDVCVGIGGINLAPSGESGVGRVRRVYVVPNYRGRGVGRMLMEQIEAWSRGHFQALQLFTDTIEGSAFYESLGYRRITADGVSHVKALAT